MSRRQARLNGLIRDEISELIRRQVKDPRLAGLLSVTEVSLSSDFKQARVYISVLGDEKEKRETLKGLSAASGFLRRELRGRLSLRSIPELVFQRDDSIERGSRLLQLIREVNPDQQEGPPEDRQP